jgi:hypothetical protein
MSTDHCSMPVSMLFTVTRIVPTAPGTGAVRTTELSDR